MRISLQSDLIGSSLSDLVWEEERIVVESLLGSWGADHESSQVTGNKGNFYIVWIQKFTFNFIISSFSENHISLSCHLRRGNLSDANFESSNYELVFFSGYYRVQGNPDSVLKKSFVPNPKIGITFVLFCL